MKILTWMILKLINFDIKDFNILLYYNIDLKQMRKANISVVFICKLKLNQLYGIFLYPHIYKK